MLETEKPIGRLVTLGEVAGRDVVCTECCENTVWEDIGVPIYPSNVLPYRAVCHKCDRELLPTALSTMPCLFGPSRPIPRAQKGVEVANLKEYWYGETNG